MMQNQLGGSSATAGLMQAEKYKIFQVTSQQ